MREILNSTPTHYCPGCSHGMIQQALAIALEKMRLQEQAIGVTAPGCGYWLGDYLNIDTLQAPPGGAVAAATGVKRAQPDRFVFTYQGDGDLAGPGLGSLMHAAMRGERITILCVNNAIGGLGGGTLSPTTLVGQATSTTPFARSIETEGKPLKLPEMLAKLPGVAFSQRLTIHHAEDFRRVQIALEDAFTYQLSGRGLGIVEILALCPTFWGMSPPEARQWADDKLEAQFSTGLFKRSTVK